VGSGIKPINVEVLLATFNGEKYLAEQLDSLLAQCGVNISLLVSDDGSTDKTLEILDTYQYSFSEFRILDGPKLGPQANFFSLLLKSTGEYVALCDQDDIWEKTHLIDSITRLSSLGPRVTFSAVTEFSSDSSIPHQIWPRKIRIGKIENLLFENYVRGCTIVMNRSFVEIVNTKHPKHSVMHDWWIALVGIGIGCLSANPQPEVRYRLHNNNFVGSSPTFKSKVWRTSKILRSGSMSLIGQIEDLNSIHSNKMNEKSRLSTSIWINPDKMESLRKQIFSLVRYRSTLMEEFLIRFLFTWIWLQDKARNK
jgi:glycosyltransferase involved in cell wall biosynthesis